jgi:hypothetical protein
VRTDDLIDALAANAGPAPGGVPARRLGLTTLAGGLIALALVLFWLHTRADLHDAMATRFFWMKAAYTAVLGVAGFWACERLARPGASGRRAFWLAAGVLVLYFAVALFRLMEAAPDDRMPMIMGNSIMHCLRNIVMLGAPMLAVALVAMRSLAPTRPTLAGFAAGLFSGAVCATIYGLHCGESTMIFVSAWYTLGVLLVGLIGAIIGRWALRW